MELPNFLAMLESEEISATVGSMFAQHDGLIVKGFLPSGWWQKSRGGDCSFFRGAEDVEKYLSSDFRSEFAKDTPWEDVTYEVHSEIDAPDRAQAGIGTRGRGADRPDPTAAPRSSAEVGTRFARPATRVPAAAAGRSTPNPDERWSETFQPEGEGTPRGHSGERPAMDRVSVHDSS